MDAFGRGSAGHGEYLLPRLCGQRPVLTPLASDRGSNQAGAPQQFSVDAERARAAGYVPISQEWTENDTVLTVRFSLGNPPADMPVWISAGTPRSDDPVAKQPRSKVKIAVAVVALALIGLTGLGGTVDKAVTPEGGTTTTSDVTAEGRTTTTSDGERWSAFKIWMTSDFPSMAVDMASVEDRANAGDLAGTLSAADAMGATATRHLAYLDAHPAAGCHSALYGDLRSAMASYQSASRSTGSEDLDSAITFISSGNTSIAEATGRLTDAEARCTA